MHVLILAGGQGSRLWPLSTQALPKQFLKLITCDSLLSQTVQNLSVYPTHVMTNQKWQKQAEMEVAGLAQVIGEPAARGTLGAVCFALAQLNLPIETTVLVAPCDGHLDYTELFKLMPSAIDLARCGNLVTFGVKPTYPATQYGYIGRGAGNTVSSFVEKPDLFTAKQLIDRNNYLWNSGFFLFKIETFYMQLREHAQQFYSFVKGELDFARLSQASIDRGLIEKSEQIAVVPYNGNWTDVGTWEGVYQALAHDACGNVVIGPAQVLDVTDSLIISQSAHLKVRDLSQMVVVESEEGTLIRPLFASMMAQQPQ